MRLWRWRVYKKNGLWRAQRVYGRREGTQVREFPFYHSSWENAMRQVEYDGRSAIF